MNNRELLEQADRRIAEIEDIKGIRKSIEDLGLLNDMLNNAITLIILRQGGMEERLDTWLEGDEYRELKGVVESNLNECMQKRITKLEQLLGIQKPISIAIDTSSVSVDQVTEKLTEILKTEADLIETLPEDKSLDKYPARKSRPDTYPADMTYESVKELYIDKGMKITEIANHFGVTYAKASGFISSHKLTRSRQEQPTQEKLQKQPDDKERP
jgi:hypothetical protein